MKSADSDHDSVLGSDDDYDERDGFFRQHKKKFHPLNCKLVSQHGQIILNIYWKEAVEFLNYALF